MPDQDPCELCGTLADPIGGDGLVVQQRCPQCGEFRLTRTGLAAIRNIPISDKAKLSGWVRDQNILNDIPNLDDERGAPMTAWNLDRLARAAVNDASDHLCARLKSDLYTSAGIRCVRDLLRRHVPVRDDGRQYARLANLNEPRLAQFVRDCFPGSSVPPAVAARRLRDPDVCACDHAAR